MMGSSSGIGDRIESKGDCPVMSFKELLDQIGSDGSVIGCLCIPIKKTSMKSKALRHQIRESFRRGNRTALDLAEDWRRSTGAAPRTLPG